MPRINLWKCDRCGREKQTDRSFWADLDISHITYKEGGGSYLLCPECVKVVVAAIKTVMEEDG